MAGRLEDQLARLLDQFVETRGADELSTFLALVDLPVSDGKSTKDQADYTPDGPEPFVCSNCEHFDEGACEIVAGGIDPAGACRFYRGQEQEHEDHTLAHVAVTNRVADG